MTLNGKKRLTWRKVERIISGTVLIVLGLFVFLFLAVQTPPVQNMIRNKMVTYLEKKLETKLSIGRMNVGFNRLSLRDLYLEDRNGDTLLAGGDAIFDISVLDLLLSNKLNISSISLQDFTANVHRSLPDTAFNFQFIVDAFTSPNAAPKDTGTIEYAIPKVQFRNMRFNYRDVVAGLNAEGVLGQMDTRINALDGEALLFDFPATRIDRLYANIYQYKPIVQSTVAENSSIESVPLLDIGLLQLKDIDVDFKNDVSLVSSNIHIKEMEVEGREFDFANRIIDLDAFALSNSTVNLSIGRSPQAAMVAKRVENEAQLAVDEGWRIRVKAIDLRNNYLKYDDNNQRPNAQGMDYAHLESTGFTLFVDDFILSDDSIGGKIRTASFREKSGFVLEDLRANVLYSNSSMFLEDLFLKTPGTELKRYARMDYRSLRELGRNFENTQMDFDISQSYVKVSDILTFAPALSQQPAFSNPNETWYLNLQGSGTLNSFHIEQLQFNGLADTRINVNGTLAIGSNASQTGGTLNIHQLHTTQSDIALFTGSRLSNASIRIPETLDITGTARGGMSGLNLDLQIGSSAGNLAVTGVLNDLGRPASASYQGNIKTGNLQLGYILKNPQLGSVSADLAVSGRGLAAGALNTDFKGQIHSLGYNGYTYRNITVDGQMHGSAVQLVADMKDPNIDLNGELVAELSATPSFRFNGFVDSLKLQPLGFSNSPVVFRGKLEADVPMITAETLEADVLITDALFVSSSQRLPLDSIRFNAGRNDSVQYLSLNSDVANARLQGQFRFGELGNMFQHALQPYFAVSGTKNIRVTEPYSVSFTADISSVPVLTDLIPGLGAFEPVHIDGTLTSASGLNARAVTSLLEYNGNRVEGLQLDMATTPAGLTFNGEVQRLKSNAFDIYHTTLSGTALNNKLDFRLGMDDATGRRRYSLAGILAQPARGEYVLNLKPDSLMLNYQNWMVSPGNSLTIGKDHLRANNFVLTRGPERIALQSSGEVLNVDFNDFQISNITAFMKSDSLLANGRLTGNMAFRNILRQPVFTSDLNIADLSIRGDTLGNAVVKVDNLSGNSYRTNATITGRGNDISLTGSFSPQGRNDIALDLELAIRKLELSTVDGALGGFIKNSSGSINGNISINGSVANPRISGPLKFDKASFALNVLGSQFRIDGEELILTENGFRFDDFVIRDTANQAMILNGFVNTKNFTKYSFDLYVQADNFQILNTTKKDNKIYYGEMVVTTDMHVGGDTDKPMVDGSITVNDGTDMTLVIPQREPGIISREGIVEFVNMDNPALDTLFRAYDSLNVMSFRGMDIAANIEVKKEAIFNIIIDEANGDFINVQGEALITTGIDPSGKITMVGSYELERGAYEISFNFLRRRFDIQKGSRIQWFNEPTRATLDVTAVYVANTSPIDLVQQQIEAATPAIRNTYLQKLPFEVRLHMTGELLQPKVAFDIVLPENRSYGVSNDIITQVEHRLAQVRTDPGETNKQVFALLLLNRFVGENPLKSSQEMFSGTAYVKQSVSRLLTAQLNSLAAGLIDGVDIRFDVTNTDDYTTGSRRSRTDLNVGLSKQLLNERLTISVGTDFELQGNRAVNSGANADKGTIGNLSVEYALTRDKRYLIRFYRKNEYQGVIDGYVLETGLGFMISVDYEKFRELITRRKKQKVEGVE